jgi:hypothetical protein
MVAQSHHSFFVRVTTTTDIIHSLHLRSCPSCKPKSHRLWHHIEVNRNRRDNKKRKQTTGGLLAHLFSIDNYNERSTAWIDEDKMLNSLWIKNGPSDDDAGARGKSSITKTFGKHHTPNILRR